MNEEIRKRLMQMLQQQQMMRSPLGAAGGIPAQPFAERIRQAMPQWAGAQAGGWGANMGHNPEQALQMRQQVQMPQFQRHPQVMAQQFQSQQRHMQPQQMQPQRIGGLNTMIGMANRNGR
jgi:hypothetical protein